MQFNSIYYPVVQFHVPIQILLITILIIHLHTIIFEIFGKKVGKKL